MNVGVSRWGMITERTTRRDLIFFLVLISLKWRRTIIVYLSILMKDLSLLLVIYLSIRIWSLIRNFIWIIDNIVNCSWTRIAIFITLWIIESINVSCWRGMMLWVIGNQLIGALVSRQIPLGNKVCCWKIMNRKSFFFSQYWRN